MICQYQAQGSVIQMWPIKDAKRPFYGPKPAPNKMACFEALSGLKVHEIDAFNSYTKTPFP